MKDFTTHIYRQGILTLMLTIFLFFSISPLSGQVFINEFQASNKSIVPEIYDFSDFPDWIELYNSGNSPVNLDGYALTDDIDDPTKYIFPNTATIPAHGFFRIWADDHEAVPGETHPRPWIWSDNFTTVYYHAPFKLSKAGEEIALFNSDGELIDHIEYGTQIADVSFGRKPDGSDHWVFFGDPTPGAANTTTGYTSTRMAGEAEISPQGGFYESSVTVTLSSPSSTAVLRYTLDGSLPDETDPIYTTPLTIEETTMLRVRAYDEDRLPSFGETQTYIFDDRTFDLPIISMTADPLFLWNDTFGIYSNALKQRNIPVKMEYFENKTEKKVSTFAALKISGQYSHTYPQKPFTITAKSKFGEDFLNYPFFSNIDNNEYKAIYLRNSGWPDIGNTYFRDALSHTIIYNQMDLDAQSYQPAIAYLNGDFWGIYNIREKLNNNYFEYHHNVNPKNINLLEYDDYDTGPDVIIVNEGSSEHFDLLHDYMATHDLSVPENYEYVKTQMDIDEYINYMITEIFVDNNNWQHCNVKWWREEKEGAKWRWILLDTDYAFGISANAQHNLLAETVGSGWSHFLFRTLNQNEEFRNEFIQRFAAYMNTTFKESRTVAIVDSLKNNIAAAIPYQIDRWHAISDWDNKVNVMRNFAAQRPTYQRQHIKNHYNISSIIDMDLSVTGGEGKIFANDVWLPEESLSGKYFAGIPLRLKAVPVAGYEFVEWEGISSARTIVITRENNFSIHAIFAPTDECIIPSEIDTDYTVDNSCDHYIALGDITVKPGAKLTIEAGVEIRMPQSANLYVRGSLEVAGTETAPVIIKPNPKLEATKWGGICFENASEYSYTDYLKLHDASKGDNDLFPGAISSYNSDIVLSHTSVDNIRKPFFGQYGNIAINDCSFHSPYTCDMINIKYANSANVHDCDIRGNDAPDTDAIDFDGVTAGSITGNTIHGFTGYNSDGIDLGEGCANILIENNLIYNLSDKGVSVGQGSSCSLYRNVITGCAQGVGIKDFGSYAYVANNTFYGNGYGVACFEKNIGHGGGTASVVNSIFGASAINSYLVDELSSINISYSISDTDTIPGTGNLSADPLFVNEYILNLELQEDSPCIDAGDPSGETDPDGSTADMGAYYTYSGNTTSDFPIVLNEINYNSRNDEYNSGDWVELYNAGSEPVDLSGWTFTDEALSHRFIIAKGTVLPAGDYLVIGNDAVLFENVYGTTVNYVGDFDFGLGNGGDVVRLFDADFKVVDYLAYEDHAPWSECADGKGSSLMLSNPELGNTLPENWAQTCGYPTPGTDNHQITAAFDYEIVNGCSGLVRLINRSSGIINEVAWQFDETDTSSEFNTSRQYTLPGTHHIQLEVFGDDFSAQISKDIYLQNTYPPPVVADGFNCEAGTVTLVATGTSGNPLWYETADATAPIFIGSTFVTPFLFVSATYYVANGTNECSGIRVPVTAAILNDITSDFDYTTAGLEATFQNKATNAIQLLWNFGDGHYSNHAGEFITHSYDEPGTYTVTLTVTGERDCTDVFEQEITVSPTSVGDLPDKDYVSVTPNPFSEDVTVHFSENCHRVSIEVFDVTGKKIRHNSLKTAKIGTIVTIDLADVPEGSYWIRIKANEFSVVKKIVK